MIGLRVVALLLFLGLLCPPALAASPGERPRVLLIGSPPSDPLVQRLAAELSELEITLIRRRSVDRLDSAAREQGALAAIRLLPARNGVEVWMADATSGRSLLRQVIVDETPGGPNYDVVALQTAELLRTSLLYEREGSPPEPPGAPPPASAPPGHETRDGTPPGANAPRSAGDAAFQAGFGALLSAGGVSPSLQLWLSAHYPLGRSLAVGLDFSAPVTRGDLDGPEGSARISPYLAGLALSARWRQSDGPWLAAGGLGAGVLRLTSEAQAMAPLENADASTTAGVAYLRADGGVAVAPWLRLGARAVTGLTLGSVEIEFAGNRAGSWGLPFFGAFALAEVPLG